jgi:hypothetical protein
MLVALGLKDKLSSSTGNNSAIFGGFAYLQDPGTFILAEGIDFSHQRAYQGGTFYM